jgi:hypothetical protein
MSRQVNYFRNNYKYNYYSDNISFSAKKYIEKYKKIDTYITDENKITNEKIRIIVNNEIEKEFENEYTYKNKEKIKVFFSRVVGILFFIALLYEQRFI